jgi:hypothetical protein
VIGHLTAGLDDQRDILLTDMNWQVANGLSISPKSAAAIAHARAPDLLLYAPALVTDNHVVGERSR